MEENEVQSIESDVSSSESSSESPNIDSNTKVESAASKSNADQATDVADQGPFHKHPRWIERDNELKTEREARKVLESRYAQMEAQLKTLSAPKQEPKPRAKFVEDLEKISPEYGKWAADMESAREQLAEMRAWKQDLEARQTSEKAVSTVNSLHDQYKVAPELRDFYNSQLIAAEQQGKIKSLTDIPGFYKTVHDTFAKFLDQRDRTKLEGYVAGKKQDASAPAAQSKGTAVSRGKTPEFSKDPAEARAQMIDRIVSQSKASNKL